MRAFHTLPQSDKRGSEPWTHNRRRAAAGAVGAVAIHLARALLPRLRPRRRSADGQRLCRRKLDDHGANKCNGAGIFRITVDARWRPPVSSPPARAVADRGGRRHGRGEPLSSPRCSIRRAKAATGKGSTSLAGAMSIRWCAKAGSGASGSGCACANGRSRARSMPTGWRTPASSPPRAAPPMCRGTCWAWRHGRPLPPERSAYSGRLRLGSQRRRARRRASSAAS